MTVISQDAPALPRKTDWRLLGLCHLLACLLYASWQIEPLKEGWAWLDEAVFLGLNGLICAAPPGIRRLAAFCNTHVYDAINAGVMGALMLFYLFRSAQKTLARRAGTVAFMGLFMFAVIFGRRFCHVMELHRASPTRVQAFCDLRAYLRFFRPKVGAGNSFPSDHFIAAFFFAAMMFRLCGRRFGLAALALAPFFFVPRLVGGAHWLSDGAVGAAAFSLVALSWALATPFADSAIDRLSALCARLLPRGSFASC